MSAYVVAPVVGAELRTKEVGPIGQVDVLRFAGASGDFNPLHWDPELATRAGFRAPVLMGQYTAAMMSVWVTDQVGIERLREFEIRFVAPVTVGDTLTFAGVVEGVNELPGSSGIRLSLEATTASGVVARASALIGS